MFVVVRLMSALGPHASSFCSIEMIRSFRGRIKWSMI